MRIRKFLSVCLLAALLSSALPAFALETPEDLSPAPVLGSSLSDQLDGPVQPEAQPSTAPEETPSDPPVQEAPQPLVLIRGSQQPSSIAAGQQAVVTITVENLNGAEMISPILTLSPSDSVMIQGGSSSFPLENIPQGQSKSVAVTLKGAETIASPAQSLGAEVRFNYDNNITQVQATVSDRIPLSAQVTASPKNVQPSVIITRTDLQPIAPDQEFSVVVSVKNVGDVTIEDTVASLTTPEGVILKNSNSSFVLGTIAPGKTSILTLNLKAASQLTNSMESLGLDLRYSYSNGEGKVQGTLSDKINIPCSVSAPGAAAAAPNIIVGSFDYGKGPVASGSRFPLTFTLQNTGNLPVENLVVTLDGGDSFTMETGTNTLYYRRLAASGKQSQTVQLQALATAKTGAQSVNISCKYDYLEGGKRTPATADIRLSVPVIQPDRFQVNAPVLPQEIFAGEEVTLSLNYVNKGKSEISNVEAILEGNVESPSKTQYLGNFESGKSGAIGFVFTPSDPGQTSITLKINYEDANQEVHTLTFPLKLEVQQAQELDFEIMDAPAPSRPPYLLILCLAGGILTALAGVIFFLKKRKVLAMGGQETDVEENWEEWEYEEPFDQKPDRERGPEE